MLDELRSCTLRLQLPGGDVADDAFVIDDIEGTLCRLLRLPRLQVYRLVCALLLLFVSNGRRK